MTTFKTNASGQDDSFPGFGLSVLQTMGVWELVRRIWLKVVVSRWGTARRAWLARHKQPDRNGEREELERRHSGRRKALEPPLLIAKSGRSDLTIRADIPLARWRSDAIDHVFENARL
jgi:hypothetical protein